MDWSKMVKMTVPVGLCGWQQRGSLTINGRTTEFPVGVETELPEPVAERIKAMIADAEEKAEHVQPLKPWMQYVTGADSVARWEPRLAYEESAVVEIMPTTDVGVIWYSQKTIACPYEGKVKIGDTGSFILDGVPHDYVAIEDIGNPPAEMTLDVDGVSNYVKLSSGKNMILYNIGMHPTQSHTIALTVNSKITKTIDPKYLPSGSGGGGVIYINDTASYQTNAYADAACTEWLTYEQGKAIMSKPYVISAVTEGYDLTVYAPFLTFGIDAEKTAGYITVTADAEGNAKCETRALVFSDSPT